MLLLKCINIMVMHNFIFSVEGIPGPKTVPGSEVNEVKAKFPQEEKVCYMHSSLAINIIEIYLQEQYIEAKNFNNEEDGPSEEDKTKNLNVKVPEPEPITYRNEAAYKLAKAVRERHNKECNIELHPNKSPAILVPDYKDNKKGETVTINYWLKELLF